MVKKVAVYCRVSTDSSDQANSLASQEKYFRSYIERHPEWELAEVFVDTGITGTSTKKRAAFNKMISEAMAGKFSLILTKEISRFARNTLDSVYYTRKLREYGVGVMFMNDNINTLEPDAELRLTIMSSIAQEESRKTSERVKWGQKRRMEQGVVFGRDLLGYDVKNGRLLINEEGAKTIRLIFHKFVNEGKGTHVIARELREAGIPTSTYMKQWTNTVILRILKNEKMAGDLIQKKTITPSYLTHEKKYNNGEEDFIVIRNHHEPIVSRDLFERAQQELERRSPSAGKKTKYSNRHCFSGKVKCAACSSSYVSRTKKRKDGSVHKTWRCYQAALHGSCHFDMAGNQSGCNGPLIYDEDLKNIMQNIAETLPLERDTLEKTVSHIVSKTLQTPWQYGNEITAEANINSCKKKIQKLIDIYVAQDISKDEFLQMKERYEHEIEILKQESAAKEKGQTSQACIQNYVAGLLSGEIWSDAFYRNILETVTITDKDTITIKLSHLPFIWQAVLK